MPSINSGIHDGWVQTFLNSSFATTRATTTAFRADSNNSRDFRSVFMFVSSRGGSTNYGIVRSFYDFDTSGVTAVPASAEIWIRGFASSTADVILVKSTQAGTVALGTADIDEIDGAATALSNSDGAGTGTLSGAATEYSAPFTTWTSTGQNTITLNAAALTDIALLSRLKICIMEYNYDFLDIAPAAGVVDSIGNYFSDDATYKPYLSYTVAAAPASDHTIFFGANF